MKLFIALVGVAALFSSGWYASEGNIVAALAFFIVFVFSVAVVGNLED